MQVDRTEEIERLKRELFDIKLKIAMRNGTPSERVELLKKQETLNKYLNTLLSEDEVSTGQVSFAFTDQIDIEKI